MPSCTWCKKSKDAEDQMRRCCEGTYYCNRKCERANFRAHKLSCPKHNPESEQTKQNGSESQQIEPDESHSPPPKPLTKHISNPFHRFKRGDYLQGRPDTDVYRLLTHAYLLREADNRAYNGNSTDGSQLDFEVERFRRFLNKAKEIPRMLPPWWSDKKQAECEAQRGGSLAYTVLPDDIQRQYGEPFMDIQLRLLAESIYGTGIGGNEHCILTEELMKIPDGCTSYQIGRIMKARFNEEPTENLIATLSAIILVVYIEEARVGE
ncbi:hypothetical protein F5B22DRAFT_643785 [Xylaria bambusicola]|uniref:uncharacterized protein n=1 Tax=Xylaria bambusicola TaxID=326684 RepID=UPI002008C01F|nr:uncharacterized protein F5B22DRAFT_643785 [Xylaria bambusicola]KAI0521614.1 hypothetical protein F5B22DRAFT_643785 [Xylaria bambusicola]